VAGLFAVGSLIILYIDITTACLFLSLKISKSAPMSLSLKSSIHIFDVNHPIYVALGVVPFIWDIICSVFIILSVFVRLACGLSSCVLGWLFFLVVMLVVHFVLLLLFVFGHCVFFVSSGISSWVIGGLMISAVLLLVDPVLCCV